MSNEMSEFEGLPAAGMVPGTVSGQPAVGHDPTQGVGTPAWQRALRMGMIVNARNRRN